LMWQISNQTPGFGQLGETWSKPLRTNILMVGPDEPVKKSVIIFGGGYDKRYDEDGVNDSNFVIEGTAADPLKGNAIFIVDAETGELIWSVSNGNSTVTDSRMTFAIPSDIRLIDMDGDNATDRLYVGDMGGQVWRVDFTGPLKKGTDTNSVVGILANLSLEADALPENLLPEDKRQIMFRPQVALINDPEFSAGEYVAVVLNTGDRENPLAKHVHDRTYVLRDYDIAQGSMGPGPVIRGNGDLRDVTSEIQDEQVNVDALNQSSTLGWYINLTESTGFIGEKGITEAQILISSKPEDPPIYTFNSYTPSNLNVGSACSVSLGQNRTYFINLLNGTGTGIIDASTQDRSKYNDAYGIAADPTVVQQEGQEDVSIGGGSTYTEEPDNLDLGDNLMPIYIAE
jgi:type IV pilus assembly protein PilY1